VLYVLSVERAMAVPNTGTVAIQYREESLRMTVIIQGHDARQLKGRALITLDRVTALVDDDTWAPVVGRMVCLEGGTELDVDDGRLEQALEDYDLSTDGPLTREALIPVVVRDIYMPPCRALVRWGDLMHKVNIIEPGDGVRASGDRVACKDRCGRCVACYYARWQAKAKALGMEIK
jgi:hypothetical protein